MNKGFELVEVKENYLCEGSLRHFTLVDCFDVEEMIKWDLSFESSM